MSRHSLRRSLPAETRNSLELAARALDRNQLLTAVLHDLRIAAELRRAALALGGEVLHVSHLALAEPTPALPLHIELKQRPFLAQALSDGQAHYWQRAELPSSAEAETRFWDEHQLTGMAFEPVHGSEAGWLLAETQVPGWPDWRRATLRLAARALSEILHGDALQQLLRNTRSELQSVQHQLQALDPTDPLTGVGSRTHLEGVLVQEVGRALREARPISLLMADIDQFTAYNQNHGQEAGDYALQQIASVIAGAFERAGETVARFDGDCFAILMSGAEAECAQKAGKRLLASIRARRLGQGPGHLRLSLGLTSLVPGPNLGPAQFLELSQRALRVAQDEGGDRMHVTSI